MDKCWWGRPSEFLPSLKGCSNADSVLFGSSYCPSYSEMEPGMVADGWLLGSLATINAASPPVIRQKFIEANPELGYYVVCFWKEDQWVQVLVDDRLLVLGGIERGYMSTQLVYASTVNTGSAELPGEAMWLSVMEKAYAKLHGGYVRLGQGEQHTTYSACDITASCPISVNKEGHLDHHNLHDGTPRAAACLANGSEDEFLSLIEKLRRKQVLMLCGMSMQRHTESRRDGLVAGREYGFVRAIDLRHEGLPVLVVIRNGWGSQAKWTGDWSDSSDRWTPRMQKLAHYCPTDRGDGEFVMAFSSMQHCFGHWAVNFLFDEHAARSIVQSQWSGPTAAGCRNHSHLLNNPQVRPHLFSCSSARLFCLLSLGLYCAAGLSC